MLVITKITKLLYFLCCPTNAISLVLSVRQLGLLLSEIRGKSELGVRELGHATFHLLCSIFIVFWYFRMRILLIFGSENFTDDIPSIKFTIDRSIIKIFIFDFGLTLSCPKTGPLTVSI